MSTHRSDAVWDTICRTESVTEGVREAKRAVGAGFEVGRSDTEPRANLYFSNFVGQRLIHAAMSSFWRASMLVGSAMEMGRYLKKSARAA
jgi:hypothetical protein